MGVAPTPRYSHSMDYFKQRNIIIIYGGRNDQIFGGSMILNEISVLNLANLNWIGVSTYGDEKPSKCCHTSIIHG